MWRLLVVLAYISPSASIAPCLAAGTGSKKARGELTIEQLVLKVRTQAGVSRPHPVLLSLMGFPSDSIQRSLEAKASDSTDGLSRTVSLRLIQPATGEATELGLFWTTRREVDRRSEGHLYRTTINGTLEKAFRVDGELDENGKEVRGGAKASPLDVGADDVRERFQREVLDFWLKGKGRKKPGSKAASVSKASNP